MNLHAALTDYFFAKDLSPRSQSWYEAKIAAFIAWCESHSCTLHQTPAQHIEDITTTHVREYLHQLRVTPSNALNHAGMPPNSQTVHGYARAIRAWLNWCIREDLLPANVTRRLEMPKRDQKVIAVFTEEQIRTLLAACRERYQRPYSWLAERDTTIVTLLLDTGIRASELCDLTLDRVRLEQDDSYIIVNGKGRKQRECPLGRKTRQQLHRYIHRYRPATRDTHVFLTRDRHGLQAAGLSAILYELKQRADITGVRCSPHDFRHTFAFQYLDRGGDVMRLSRLLGHTDLTVTQGYLQAFSSRDARRGYVSVFDGMMNRRG